MNANKATIQSTKQDATTTDALQGSQAQTGSQARAGQTQAQDSKYSAQAKAGKTQARDAKECAQDERCDDEEVCTVREKDFVATQAKAGIEAKTHATEAQEAGQATHGATLWDAKASQAQATKNQTDKPSKSQAYAPTQKTAAADTKLDAKAQAAQDRTASKNDYAHDQLTKDIPADRTAAQDSVNARANAGIGKAQANVDRDFASDKHGARAEAKTDKNDLPKDSLADRTAGASHF